MSSRRPLIILLGMSLLLVANRAFPAEPTSLPDTNTVSGLQVNLGRGGTWTASFDYFYTGKPYTAVFQVDLLPEPAEPGYPRDIQSFLAPTLPPQRGAHRMTVLIAYPGRQHTSRQVRVTMLAAPDTEAVLASQTVDQVIDWPDPQVWQRDRGMATVSPEENFKRAVAFIDTEQETALNEARTILEKLIAQDPKYDAAYVELARIAMKSNWGPEGLHEVENLLDSALQIRPDSANAKILLGYVYTHQKRFALAEAMFIDAARSNPRNLWLWTNWGELLSMQRKLDQAIVKYREAITRPMTHDTYDRARAAAYVYLLKLMDEKKDLDAMEALYKQRIEEFGPDACYSSDYARFMLNVRGNPQGAIDLSRRALHQNCEDSESRQILGLAHYVKWAAGSGAESADALNQARIFLPASATALYQLATSDRTVPAARKLIASGESIEQKDNEKLTALAHALQNQDLAACKRLLTLGASPSTQVGYGDMPVALLPVIEGNIEAIRVLQRAGVDYSKLRYQGATAIDFAKQTGNTALLEVLTRKDLSL